MGLYLCVFEGNDELEGVEVGSYADFNFFRETVTQVVENGKPGAVCPLLYAHSDSDGEWTSQDAHYLLEEFSKIKNVMSQHPPIEFNSEWKKDVARVYGIRPQTLLDCFFDIDGELLVDRFEQLAQLSIATGNSILFQ
jgi:hypothetical protein